MDTISFGTSGWRGLLAEDFTLPNVRAVTQAIAEYLISIARDPAPVIVAHDTRFLAEEFSRAASAVLAGNGLPVIRALNPYPTPGVAWEILHRGAVGAVNITASHNPHVWNGLKFSPESGGPALPETTAVIEKRANAILRGEGEVRQASAARWNELVREEVLGGAYRAQLARVVDFDVLRGSRMRLVVDPLYGTSSGILDVLLRGAGIDLVVLHATRDPYFGGKRPEPEGHSLEDLVDAVRREKAMLGLATDCDADRFGIVDADGTYFSANHVLALLVDYLAKTRGWSGAVGRSVATTHLVDAAAAAAGLEVVETPVGFKFLGELLAQQKILMAGEESGGFSIVGHVPDKDGILACLLVAEMVARRGVPLRVQLERLFARVGVLHSVRRDLPWSHGKAALAEKLRVAPERLAGKRITRTVTTDGTKWILEDGSWVLVRASGTEPIIRIYSEAASEVEADGLASEFGTLIGVHPV